MKKIIAILALLSTLNLFADTNTVPAKGLQINAATHVIVNAADFAAANNLPLASYNYLFSTNCVLTNVYTHYDGSEQGCFNDGTNAFFNDTFSIWFPSGTNLSASNTVVITIGSLTNYGGLNYNHMGDGDYAYGHVYMPLGGTNQAIAVFNINYATSNFTLLSVTGITNQLPGNGSGYDASSLTVDTNHALIYVSDFTYGTACTNMVTYSTNFTFVKKIIMSQSIQGIQGIKYYNGVILVQSDYGPTDGSVSNANIWVVSPDTGDTRFLCTITNRFAGGEVEGLDVFGTNLVIQGVTMQYGVDLSYFPLTNSILLDAAGNLNNAQLFGTTINNGAIVGGTVSANLSGSTGFPTQTNSTVTYFGTNVVVDATGTSHISITAVTNSAGIHLTITDTSQTNVILNLVGQNPNAINTNTPAGMSNVVQNIAGAITVSNLAGRVVITNTIAVIKFVGSNSYTVLSTDPGVLLGNGTNQAVTLANATGTVGLMWTLLNTNLNGSAYFTNSTWADTNSTGYNLAQATNGAKTTVIFDGSTWR